LSFKFYTKISMIAITSLTILIESIIHIVQLLCTVDHSGQYINMERAETSSMYEPPLQHVVDEDDDPFIKELEKEDATRVYEGSSIGLLSFTVLLLEWKVLHGIRHSSQWFARVIEGTFTTQESSFQQ
jgi:hypothetical protein